MIVSHISGPSVLSEQNLPHVKQQIQEESTSLTGAITSQERRKTYQEAMFCGRKVCAQTTSILCCPLCMTCFCLCDFSSYSYDCSYERIQRRGGWRQWLMGECCPTPSKPAEDCGDLCSKFLDPVTFCRPCQEPAIHYSTATERDIYETTKSSIATLKTQEGECSKIKTFFDSIEPLVPAPVEQIMAEYAVTATNMHKLDKNQKPTYKLEMTAD